MISAHWIVGADSKTIQCTSEYEGKFRSGRNKAAERSLGTSARGIDQYPAAVDVSVAAHARQSVDPLLQRAGWIATNEGYLSHQCVGWAVKKYISRPRIGRRLTRKALLPVSISQQQVQWEGRQPLPYASYGLEGRFGSSKLVDRVFAAGSAPHGPRLWRGLAVSMIPVAPAGLRRNAPPPVASWYHAPWQISICGSLVRPSASSHSFDRSQWRAVNQQYYFALGMSGFPVRPWRL